MSWSRRQKVRRRFWRPRSMEALPDWNKYVKTARARMSAYDDLPPEIRMAISFANIKFDTKQLLDLWNKLNLTQMKRTEQIAYLLKAIEAND